MRVESISIETAKQNFSGLLPAVTRHHPFPLRGGGAGGHDGHDGQGELELFSQHGEFLVRILLRYNRHWQSQTLVGSK